MNDISKDVNRNVAYLCMPLFGDAEKLQDIVFIAFHCGSYSEDKGGDNRGWFIGAEYKEETYYLNRFTTLWEEEPLKGEDTSVYIFTTKDEAEVFWENFYEGIHATFIQDNLRPNIPVRNNLIRITWIKDKRHWGINTYYNDISYYLGTDDRWGVRMYRDVSQEIEEYSWPTRKEAAMFYEQHCNKIIRKGMLNG